MDVQVIAHGGGGGRVTRMNIQDWYFVYFSPSVAWPVCLCICLSISMSLSICLTFGPSLSGCLC